ncbi:uncharacterized protein EKO05_0009944 [Ascochyta rabiei]|uniref:Uncharacterized protein n=1 Tax=Didymella rabiei TaxID=5454 RepID=A0A162WQ84_DIDRA|nr:uncharacterized protein EKO05_0009944 [Ascochyta rabiei]KZM19162.1 hypothetical protein ST47_g9693 [Ascochyta rabiei]UPX19689.1 hypothetical protein EKO05_0009944 [Ascochyta rabiei]
MHVPTEVGILSHAHPSPTKHLPRSREEQRLRALISRQTINVNLRGLSCEHAATVSEILAPKIRRSPFNEEVTASHLDLTECWRGLSHSQATELLMWYHFLHKCLQSEVRVSLYEDLVKGLLQSKEAIDEVYLVPRMLEHLHSHRHRVIDVSFIDLMDSMMGMFHDRFPHAAAATASNWSHFSGGLSLFLQNFLRIQDCFYELPDGPCLLVDFDFTYADYTLTATGDVTWHLPDVRILNLSSSRFPGEEYRITPFMLKESHSPVSPYDCDDYIDQVSYTLPRSPLNFSWNAMKQCFQTVVPECGHMEVQTAETVLCATTTTPFPDHVLFERQSRWSIKLEIAPAKINVKPLVTSNDEGVRLDGFNKNETMDAPRYGVAGIKMRVDSRGLDHDTVLQKIFGNDTELPSLPKRKVSRPGLVDVGFNAKRRRRNLAQETEDEASPQTHSNHDSIQTDWCCENDSACAADGCSNAAHPEAARCHTRSPNMSSRTEHNQPKQHDGSTPFTEIGTPCSTKSAPNSTVERAHAGLRQQQIMHNYQEFAEHRLYKDAGMVSPVSDGERTAFENIFLDDDEPWSPVTDSSAVDLDTVMSET